jgi:CDP-diglyceride synthetase
MKAWFNNIWKTYVFDPLAGGNGKVQTAELAQWLLLIMIARASYHEGKSTEQVYPDIYWIMIFTSVCAIAGFKEIFRKSKNETNNNP